MKMVTGLGLLLVGCTIASQLTAHVVLTNRTAYEIKAVVHWAGGRGGYAPFPAGSLGIVSGNYAVYGDRAGLLPGQESHTWDDWSDIKTAWKVWAKVDGKWSTFPVAESSARGYGGLISPVRASVTNTVDEEGKPQFFISVETGS